MELLKIVDSDFSLKSTSHSNLSILLGVDRFFYMIDDGADQILAIKKIQIPKVVDRSESLHGVLLGEAIFQQGFASVKICHSSSYFTLVPKLLNEPAETRTYLSQVCDLPDNHLAFKNPINTLDLCNVYGLNDDDFHLFNRFFPNAKHFHLVTTLLNAFQNVAAETEGDQLFVNIQSSEIAVFLFNNGKLQFSNFFKFKDSKDFLYFILLVIDQHHLNQEFVQVNLTGKVVQKSQVFDLLSKYIRNVRILKEPKLYKLSSDFSEMEAHQYFDLFSLKLCE